MAESEIEKTARSMILLHGARAVSVARHSADKFRTLDLPERVAWWDRVVIEMTKLQAEQPATRRRTRARFRGVR